MYPIPSFSRLLIAAICSVGGLVSHGDDSSAGTSRLDPGKSQIHVLGNQQYGEPVGRDRLCDVYLPQSSASAPSRPVVLVVHGGAWVSGDKFMVNGYARAIAQCGIVSIAINYHLAPKHKFPTQVDDVRQALLWTKENARRFSIDTNRIGLFGYSAGGHLSALIGSLGDEPTEVRAAASHWSIDDHRWKELPKIRAVCVGGPPVDFRPLPADNSTFSFFLGGSRRQQPETYIAASPAAHISAADPATQIIHGEADLLVPIIGSRLFHRAQVLAGVDSRLEVMPGQGHIATFFNPKTSQKVLEFFQDELAD